MTKIKELSTISGNHEWYVVFDDSDSSTDYFHSSRGSQKYMAEIVNKYGSEVINVDLQNGTEVKERDVKSVKRLAKKTGYIF